MLHLSDYDAIVLGAGPVGLVAASALARKRRVALITHQLPAANDPPRVEAVPAALLTLLLEFGVHPAELGVTRLYESRVSAWEAASPDTQAGPAMAHIERPALELALLHRALATPRLDLIQRLVSAQLVEQLSRAAKPGCRLLDATGRRAVSAVAITQPPRPWGSRGFWFSNERQQFDGTFGLAALPDGYVYRLGSSRLTGLGFVGRGKLLKASAQELRRELRSCGVDWILVGLPPLEQMKPGKTALASVQWATNGAAMMLGDAALARDALSSQGLSCGISEALYAAAGKNLSSLLEARQTEQRGLHLQSLGQLISRCRYHHLAAWQSYAAYIEHSQVGARPDSAVALNNNRLVHVKLSADASGSNTGWNLKPDSDTTARLLKKSPCLNGSSEVDPVRYHMKE